jgi:NlpC/P60 family putative phage cell wall peptidase
MTCADPQRVIAAAQGWIGTPFHHQASLLGVGCDCLGLVRGIWREVIGPELFEVPPYSPDWGEAGAREVLRDGVAAHLVPVAGAPAPGDLILFRMREWAIAKHAGVLIAPDKMVHAHSRLGVIEERVSPAWQRRVAFVFRFPD